MDQTLSRRYEGSTEAQRLAAFAADAAPAAAAGWHPVTTRTEATPDGAAVLVVDYGRGDTTDDTATRPYVAPAPTAPPPAFAATPAAPPPPAFAATPPASASGWQAAGPTTAPRPGAGRFVKPLAIIGLVLFLGGAIVGGAMSGPARGFPMMASELGLSLLFAAGAIWAWQRRSWSTAVRAIVAGLLVLFTVGGVGAAFRQLSDGAAAAVPIAITSPADGQAVSGTSIVVSGTAAPGARIVRDISGAPDQSTTADSSGRWSMTVALTPGDGTLTFRVGDDKSTAVSLHLALATAVPSAVAEASQAPSPTETTAPTAAATATPTDTPAPPSDAPSAEPTAAPTEAPVNPLAFTPVTLTGRGDKVAKFTIPQDVPAIAVITCSQGYDNFAVETLAADGSENDLLVNTIGSYKGTVLFDEQQDQHSVAFKVTAAGSWTIAVKPITSAAQWSGASSVTGKGDQVLYVTGDVSGLATFKITHKGTSNFAVIAYTDTESDLLVNEIGNYSGEQLLPSGTLLVAITADGTWAMTPQ